MSYRTTWDSVRHCIARNEPVIIWGPPGVGKSFHMYTIAQELGWPLMEFRVAQLEPIDLRVIPSIEGGLTKFNPPSELPQAERDGENGILFMDEFNLARVADDTRAACFQLIDLGRLGPYQKPRGWRIVVACNPTEMK